MIRREARADARGEQEAQQHCTHGFGAAAVPSLGSGGGGRGRNAASSASYAAFTVSALSARSFVAGGRPPHHTPLPSTHASTAHALGGRLGHATATAATRRALRLSTASADAPTTSSTVCQMAQMMQVRCFALQIYGQRTACECTVVPNVLAGPVADAKLNINCSRDVRVLSAQNGF